MRLEEARRLALALLAEHQLIQLGWTFSFDGACNRAGLCSFRRKRISLSAELTQKATNAQVRETILHEIAHALVGPAVGHSEKWRTKARSIGCSGARLHNIEVDYKYVGYCPSCLKVLGHYQRKRKLIHKVCRTRLSYAPIQPTGATETTDEEDGQLSLM